MSIQEEPKENLNIDTGKVKIQMPLQEMPNFHVRNYEQPLAEQIAYYIDRALQWKATLKFRNHSVIKKDKVEFILPSVRVLANFFVCPMSTIVNALVNLRDNGYRFEVKGFDLPLRVEPVRSIQTIPIKNNI